MMKPKFCIPVQATTLQELQRKVKQAALQADIVEVWLDHIRFEMDQQSLFSFTKKPFLLVNKLPNEGGKWRGSKQKNIEFLQSYMRFHPAYIDVSLDTPPVLLAEIIAAKKSKTKLILSYHNFSRTPSLKMLQKIMKKGFRCGADIVKIATFANTLEDNFTINCPLYGASWNNKPTLGTAVGIRYCLCRTRREV